MERNDRIGGPGAAGSRKPSGFPESNGVGSWRRPDAAEARGAAAILQP